MSTKAIVDHLTKQLFIERNIVTFRSLSREFGLHVQTAKSELALYHDNAPSTSFATYLVSGEVALKKTGHERETQDTNVPFMRPSSPLVEYEGGDDVPQMRVTLVNEKDLEATKSFFTFVSSVHTYSLSPSPVHDAGLLCAPTDRVRELDTIKGAEMASSVDKAVGKHVPIQTKCGSETAITSNSKSNVDVKKGIALSSKLSSKEDEEEFVPKLKPSRRKSRSSSQADEKEKSETEKAVLALMDIDDDRVVKASRDIIDQSINEDAEEMEDVGLDVEVAPPKPKAKQRTKKSSVPVGKNGLKRKRVMKSRTKVDDKGYTVTEDYSSYESVDEEEIEEKTTKRSAKAKTHLKLSGKKTDVVTSSSAGIQIWDKSNQPKNKNAIVPKSIKSTGTTQRQPQNIAMFFNRKPKK